MTAKSVASPRKGASSRVHNKTASKTPAPHPAAAEVKRRMEAAGLKIIELAAKADVDRGYLSRVLAGKVAEPSIKALEKLAGALGTTLPELLGFEAASGNGQAMVALQDIADDGGNVRQARTEAGIEALAGSIAAVGLLQPIGVRPPDAQGAVDLVYGFRRVAALWELRDDEQWSETEANIPVVFVDEDTDEKDRILIQLAENLGREDMNPLDEGEAYRLLIDDKRMESEDIARIVGKSRRLIQDRAKIARDLCANGKRLMEAGKISAAQASALILAPGGVDQQEEIVARIEQGEPGLSTEAGIRQALGLDKPAAADDADDLLGSFDRTRERTGSSAEASAKAGTQPDGSFTLMGAEETGKVMAEAPRKPHDERTEVDRMLDMLADQDRAPDAEELMPLQEEHERLRQIGLLDRTLAEDRRFERIEELAVEHGLEHYFIIGHDTDDDAQMDLEDLEWDGPNAQGVWCKKRAKVHEASTGNPESGHLHAWVKIYAVEAGHGWIACCDRDLRHISGTAYGAHYELLRDNQPREESEAHAVAELAEQQMQLLETIAAGADEGALAGTGLALLPKLYRQLLVLAGRGDADLPHAVRPNVLQNRYDAWKRKQDEKRKPAPRPQTTQEAADDDNYDLHPPTADELRMISKQHKKKIEIVGATYGGMQHYPAHLRETRAPLEYRVWNVEAQRRLTYRLVLEEPDAEATDEESAA